MPPSWEMGVGDELTTLRSPSSLSSDSVCLSDPHGGFPSRKRTCHVFQSLRHTEKKPGEDGVRDWSNVATGQEHPEHQRQGGAGAGSEVLPNLDVRLLASGSF